MKKLISVVLLVATLFAGISAIAEEVDFVNAYMCTFHEDNIIGPRVVSMVEDNTGYYLDTISGFAIEMTWKREGNMLSVTPADESIASMTYIIINEEGVYSLVDMNGNIYKVIQKNNSKAEDESNAKYTKDDVLGKWISKETKQIIHIKPQYTSHFIFEGGGLANDTLTLYDETLELKQIGTFAIEPFNDTLKLICTKTGDVAKGSEFVKVKDIVDEKALYGTWKGSKETKSTITIDESGVYYSLTHTKNNKSSTTRSGSSSLNFAGDTIYLRTMLTLTIVVDNGNIKLITDNDCFTR